MLMFQGQHTHFYQLSKALFFQACLSFLTFGPVVFFPPTFFIRLLQPSFGGSTFFRRLCPEQTAA